MTDKAPKKIWLLPGLAKKLAWARTKEAETPYIRADIVDELVVALSMVERFIKNLRVPQNTFEAGLQVIAGEKVLEKTEAALKKLEESHE